MKKIVRWVGAAIMAAAALTMVLADIALAAPRDEFILKFDVFSPPGITCQVDGQGIETRVTRGLTGNPVVRVLGDARNASIICTLADGSRWRVAANATAPYTPSDATWVTAFVRPGKSFMGGLTEIGIRAKSVYDPKTLVPAN